MKIISVKTSKSIPSVKKSVNIRPSCHAEENVCKDLPYNFKTRGGDKSNYNIIVFRYYKGTCELASSRPCFRCIKIMQKSKINNVYYSDSSGNIIRESVNSMDPKTAHVTSGIRRYMNNRL